MEDHKWFDADGIRLLPVQLCLLDPVCLATRRASKRFWMGIWVTLKTFGVLLSSFKNSNLVEG